MTATAVDRDTKQTASVEVIAYPVYQATSIPAGTAVALNASGYAVRLTNSAAVKFCGIADEAVDNTDGDSGDLYIKVRRTGSFIMVCSGLSAGSALADMYWADNQTVQTVATNVYAGRLVKYTSATTAQIDIGMATGGPPVVEDTDEIFTIPVAATTSIASGDLVCANASGYAVSAANTSALKLEGVAQSAADNSAGSAGDITVTVKRTKMFTASGAGLAVGDLGKYAWAGGAKAMSLTPGFCLLGTVAQYISATSCVIDLTEGYALARTPGNIVAIGPIYLATLATTPGTVLFSTLELPRKARLTRCYLDLATAPGGSDTVVATLTDGTSPKALTATGAAVTAEDEACTEVFLANTNISLTIVRSGTTAAGATFTAFVELL